MVDPNVPGERMNIAKLKSSVTWVSALALSLALVVGMISTWGWAVYGSPWAIPALARRQVVIVRPGVVSVGRVEVGRRYAVAVELINLSGTSVTVTGYQSDCTCVSVEEDLPLDLPAYARRNLPLVIAPKARQAGGPFAQSIGLYLSVPGVRPSISVAGTVAPITTTTP